MQQQLLLFSRITHARSKEDLIVLSCRKQSMPTAFLPLPGRPCLLAGALVLEFIGFRPRSNASLFFWYADEPAYKHARA